MGSKKGKPKKDKRSKKELVKEVASLTLGYATQKEKADLLQERVDDLKADMIPALVVKDAITRACPPGTKCNAMVAVVIYPCGGEPVVVKTQRNWWLSW